MTIKRLAEMSLELAGVIGAGVEADDDMMQTTLDFLRIMLGGWNTDNLMIPEVSTNTFSTIPAKQEVSVGPGMDLSMTCPVSVEGVTIHMNGLSYALSPVAEEYIRSLRTVWSESIPNSYCYLPGIPTASILFSSIPVAGCSLSIRSLKALDISLGMTDETTLPEGYNLAIVYGLTVLIAPIYHKPLDQAVASIAASSYDQIKRRNAHLRETMPLKMDAGMPGVYSGYSSGWGY